MRALALALLAVLGPLAAFPVGVGAQVPTGLDGQSPSTLSGTVRNGTAGAAPPIGLRVTLSYQVASGELVEHDTITALDGSFTFTNLPQQGLPGFELRADYLDVEYTNRVLGEPLTGPLDLTVYELTSDFSVLSLVDDTLAVTGADGSRRQFAVLEAARLRNASDRTFRADVLVDGPMSMVRFSLPTARRTWTSRRRCPAATCCRSTAVSRSPCPSPPASTTSSSSTASPTSPPPSSTPPTSPWARTPTASWW